MQQLSFHAHNFTWSDWAIADETLSIKNHFDSKYAIQLEYKHLSRIAFRC
jgi:hypothetical protein